MPLVCPACRAENASSPCRRCKADLSLLFALENRRQFALGQAACAVKEGAGADALRWARLAIELRPCPDADRVTALGHLLAGDYSQAFTVWARSQRESAR